jgi:mRNA-degrading endonuclease RelE of RelBE toxin-antitoxin system
MIWYDNYYRIRIWDYRLWIKNDDDKCIVLRFKHRKDIYKNFP